jgi:hypothetical protein
MGGVPAVTRHENKSTKQKMKAEHGNRVYDRIANETASAGNGHRLAPAAASILLNDTTPPGPPTSAAFRPTLEASRWRSGIFRENITINRQTTIMKKNSMKTMLLALAGSVLLPVSAIAANELPEHHKKLYGEGLCAKCELKETEKCQTAIRVTEGDRKVFYYAKDNDVAKAFHSKICKSVEPVKAFGNVQEKDGKRHITLTHIEVREH